MNSDNRPTCAGSVVGSFPHDTAERICDLILEALPEVPGWPQLPNRSHLENMYIQYSEKLPAVVIDQEKQRIYFDTTKDIYADLEQFYTHFLSSDLEYFKISPDYAQGLYTFVEKARSLSNGEIQCVKGQITGPISFGLTVTDENKKAILYHDELFDAVMKNCIMKTRWQIRMLKQVCPTVIMMIDEPYLSAFGSGYISLSREQVVEHVGTIVQTIDEEGAIPGVHCCGNTDWSIVMDTGARLLNFDAAAYFQGFTLYPDRLQSFFKRGGMLAWGIVPTSDRLAEITLDDLLADLAPKVLRLKDKGFSEVELFENCIITPSCGLGTLAEKEAEKAVKLTSGLSAMIKDRYLA